MENNFTQDQLNRMAEEHSRMNSTLILSVIDAMTGPFRCHPSTLIRVRDKAMQECGAAIDKIKAESAAPQTVAPINNEDMMSRAEEMLATIGVARCGEGVPLPDTVVFKEVGTDNTLTVTLITAKGASEKEEEHVNLICCYCGEEVIGPQSAATAVMSDHIRGCKKNPYSEKLRKSEENNKSLEQEIIRLRTALEAIRIVAGELTTAYGIANDALLK